MATETKTKNEINESEMAMKKTYGFWEKSQDYEFGSLRQK